MILKGKKIILRPIQESDFALFYKWHSDESIRFLAAMHPFPVTEGMEKDWFESVNKDYSNKKIIFVAEEKTTNKAIGYFQLMDINFINSNAMLGIVIGEDEFRGKGLGKEIMDLGISYAFNYLRLRKISLDVNNSNEKAINLYKRIGFIEEGFFKEQLYFKGSFFNILRMACFKK